jgi:hypothetical protein
MLKRGTQSGSSEMLSKIFFDNLLPPRQSVAPAHREIMAD